MKKHIKKLLYLFGIEIRKCKSKPNVITLEPEGLSIGNVLLAYVTDPFLVEDESLISNRHTHHWESYLIAKAFLEMGYTVDVISYRDDKFKPLKNYSVFVSARIHFERIAKLLNNDCLKIAHLDTAHWLSNNSSIMQRSLGVQENQGVTLASFKFIEYNWAIEYADCATVLGNQFTIDTYQYANKPIYRIPISSCNLYPWSTNKDFEECRQHFVWFGSRGFVHKGLDLVLKAFANMPEYHLYVCGPIGDDQRFEEAFRKELYHAPNIHTVGWVDVNSDEFLEICHRCVALVYPSCAEGGGGSVIQCMHAGIIPMVSYEASVDISDDYGFILKNFSVAEIMENVRLLSGMSADKVEQMSRKSWKFARANHTRDRFFEVFKQTMQTIISNKNGGL